MNGLLIFLPALRSKNSSGIGEYLDLIPMIDWCAELGLKVIQLLPINDTGDDSSPYNAMSSCALNPNYISLPEPLPKEEKFEFLRQQFHHERPDLTSFRSQNPWLQGDDFYCYLQQICFDQMRHVKEYATVRGIHLFGDIPILLSRQSVDVKSNPHLFDLSLDAGAPPDFYNLQGQHWGFPLYNWDAMRKENFHWWKQRLKVAEQFFHMVRIDHVMGLFRMWGIPKGKKPIEGHYVPIDSTLWHDQGREILKMILTATKMEPVAEDLGTVPTFVRPTLKELGICRTVVPRWERHWDGDKNFIPYSEYEPLSLTTVSTPDSDLIAMWWKKYPEEAAQLAKFKQWAYKPELSREQHLELLRDSHQTPSKYHVNLLQEYLTLFPELSWPDPETERINIPGTVLPTNWAYRYRPAVEEITAHKPLAKAIRDLCV